MGSLTLEMTETGITSKPNALEHREYHPQLALGRRMPTKQEKIILHQ